MRKGWPLRPPLYASSRECGRNNICDSEGRRSKTWGVNTRRKAT